jgi:hypothetical protein
MKAEFSKQYVLDNKGCYDTEQVESLPFDKSNTITLEKLFEVLPIKDFCWWLVKKCDLTDEQKKAFVINNLLLVKTDYEQIDSKRQPILDYINLVYGYLNGDITKEKYYASYSAAYSSFNYAANYASDSAAYFAANYASDSAAYFVADSAAYFAANYAAYSAANSAAYFVADYAANYAANSAANYAANYAAVADSSAFKESIRVLFLKP